MLLHLLYYLILRNINIALKVITQLNVNPFFNQVQFDDSTIRSNAVASEITANNDFVHM